MVSARLFFPVALLVCLLFVQPCAARVCTGLIGPGGGTVTEDIIVPTGKVCELNGVDVTGSVIVGTGAGFATSGKMRIFGVVSATNCGTVMLTGNLLVSGGVTISKCKQVDVGPQAAVSSLTTADTSTVILQGMVAILTFRGSGNLVVSGGKILGGGISRSLGKGSTSLCGAKVRGGIKFSQVFGDFSAAASAGCAPSDICGTIEVGKGFGSVKVGGGMLLGADLIVFNQKGNVDVYNSQLSDVSIKGISGLLKLNGVVADSDASISGVKKTVSVSKSAFDGDFGLINNPGTVTIQDNDFTQEDLLISNNGFVNILRNSNFSFTATENKGINVANNKFITTASVSKNTGSTVISGNSFTELTCAGNTGKFSGKGNSVIFSTGQCALF